MATHVSQDVLSGKASIADQSLGNDTAVSRLFRKHFVPFASVFLAYVIAGKLGQATASIRSSNLGPVWPAYGVALASFLLYGYRVWPTIAAGAILVALLGLVGPAAALGQATGTTVAALAGTFLLRRVANFDNSLARLRDALALILLGALASATVSATIGVAVLFASHIRPYSGFGAAWLIYWLGDSTGVMLVTPLALTISGVGEIRKPNRAIELIALLLLLTTACFLVFGDLNLIPFRLHFLAFAVLPFVMWATIRFGVLGASLSVLLAATVATIETALGAGPFSFGTPFTKAVLLDVFFWVLSVSGLTLASVIAERENAKRHHEQAIRVQAKMEVRLQDAITLRESEERWHLAAQAGKMYAYEWDAESDVIVRAGEFANALGQSTNGSRLTRQQLLEKVHPDDRAQFNASVAGRTPENPDTQITYRVMRPDGSYVWVQKTAHAFFDKHGKMLRMIGMVADITERKQAEDALAQISRKLVKVQEDERTRIARDLHDDINQRLAILAIEAEQLKQNSGDSATVANGLTELQQQISKISSAVQSISHELHSPQLEYLGIVSAMKSLCREFAASQKWEVGFNADEITQPVPREVSECLFRVLQEAVHNAAKYSKTRTLQVSLHRQLNQLQLTISDQGVGFDVEAAMSKGGLGLVSMRERVRLIGGSIDFNSAPMHGTTIRVCAPLS